MIYLAILGGCAIFWLGYGLGYLHATNQAISKIEAYGAPEGGTNR